MCITNSDSHEFLGDDNNTSSQSGSAVSTAVKSESQKSDPDESMETETASETAAADDRNGKSTTEDEGGQEMELTNTATDEEMKKEEEEYNPLIVRRSQRAIKPTKDVDLYLLGAKFGIDVEGSDADSSDLEFAPAVDSDRKSRSHFSFSIFRLVIFFGHWLNFYFTLYTCIAESVSVSSDDERGAKEEARK